VEDSLHTELWTSWASLLRSYAAAHGLNSTQHAVVEVSATEITLRVGSRWLRFTPNEVTASNRPPLPFHLNENGTATVGSTDKETIEPREIAMDLAAEHFAREMMQSPQ
jgi:head-tail adaptor